MAISLNTIYDKIANYHPDEEDIVGKAARRKILEAAEEALNTPDGGNFREVLFAGNLRNDHDSWKLIHKVLPNESKELLQLRMGSPFQWEPKQVSMLMGFSDPIDLVRTNKANTSVPAWRLGRGDTPEDIKRSLKNEYLGIFNDQDIDRLYNWLEAYDAQYQNQKKYTGGAKNATRGIFLPRVQESLQRYGNSKAKDWIGDLGENALQAVAWAPSRVIAHGARALGLTNKVARAAEPVLSAAFVPTAMGIYDAAAYDPKTNPNRSDFSPVKTLKETAINLATVPAVSSRMSAYGRAAGLEGPGRKEIASSLSTDPYVEAQHALADMGKYAPAKSGKSATQLQIESDIVKAVQKGRKNEKNIGKQQRENWENWITLEAPDNVFNNFISDMESIKKLPEPYRTTALKEFDINREVVYPTELLPKDLRIKYGVSEDGRLGLIGRASGLNPSHHVPTTLDPSRSASNLKSRAKHGHTDYVYNRESPFDVAVTAAENDPLVIANIAKWDPSTISRLTAANFIGNKLGKADYSSRVGLDKGAGEDIIHGISEDVKVYLNDRALNKMWDMGFEPSNKDDDKDPMVKAWKIYTNKEK